MRKLFASLWVCGGVALSITTGYAGEALTVRAEISKGFITIGERVQYTVLIRHSPKIRILSPLEFSNARDFEVKSSRDISPKEENGMVMTGRQFEITAYGLGEFVIDEIPVEYLTQEGERKEIRTNRIYVTVESVDKSGKPKMDIRGIKGPVNLASTLKVWITWSIVTLLLTTGGFALWKKLVQAKGTQTSKEVTLSPHEEAYQGLRRLFDSSLIREGRIKDYYYHLSEIIKRYLERRFQFAAFEKTTPEIARNLREIDLDDSVKNFIRQFLEDADFVKFAKYLPEPQEIILMNKRGLEIVDKTKLVEELSVVTQSSAS